MGALDFCWWLQGFTELNGGKPPTDEQWKSIVEHLNLVYKKVTAPVVPWTDKGVAKMIPQATDAASADPVKAADPKSKELDIDELIRRVRDKEHEEKAQPAAPVFPGLPMFPPSDRSPVWNPVVIPDSPTYLPPPFEYGDWRKPTLLC